MSYRDLAEMLEERGVRVDHMMMVRRTQGYATITGFEVMRAVEKGQGSLLRHLPRVAGEVSLVNRLRALLTSHEVPVRPDRPLVRVCRGASVAPPSWLSW